MKLINNKIYILEIKRTKIKKKQKTMDINLRLDIPPSIKHTIWNIIQSVQA